MTVYFYTNKCVSYYSYKRVSKVACSLISSLSEFFYIDHAEIFYLKKVSKQRYKRFYVLYFFGFFPY